MSILKGNLLFANSSLLYDNTFNKSVVLLTNCEKNETIGYILNKPTSLLLKDIFPVTNCDFPIYFGGPVEQDNLFFIHSCPKLIANSISITEELYEGGNFELICNLLVEKKIKSTEIRFFLGYSGWGANQLEKEIENKFWILENQIASTTILQMDVSTLWKNKINNLGGNFSIFANAPDDPLWN